MMDDSELENLTEGEQYDPLNDEDEYDMINDETFGDIAEYNWEESNLQLKENIPDQKDFLHAQKENWEEVDEYGTVEEEMEANVSKLLLDDMDDCISQEDEKGNSLFYTASQIRDKKLYTGGPALGWVDERELEDPNSVLGSAVWGVGSSSGMQPQGQGLQQDYRNQRQQIPEKPNVRPMNLQELEEEFFKENAESSRKPAKVIRAEDLERELKAQSELRHTPTSSQCIGAEGPPPPHLMHNINALRPAPNSAFPLPMGHHRFDLNHVKHVLREHGYAQDFNRNARIFPQDEMRNKPFPMMPPPLQPQYVPHPHLPPPQYRVYGMPPVRPDHINFDGLMTERDKQRIRNIQIIQLQNDHPHKNDYYYQMSVIRNNPSNKALQEKALKKLYPPNEPEKANKVDYKPVQFDKSLGKIQAVSAQAPKRIFDLDENVRGIGSGVPKQLVPGYHRWTLMMIEEIFTCLRKVDVLAIKTYVLKKETADDDGESIYDRANLLSQAVVLSNALSDNIPKILQYRKGRVLAFKALPRLPGPRRMQLLVDLIRYFDVWVKTLDNDNDYGIVLKTLLSVIMDLELSDGLNLILNWSDKLVLSLLQSRLGLSIFNMFLYKFDRFRAEMQVKDLGPKMLETYEFCLHKVDWDIIPCVLTPKYIDEMMQIAIHKCDSVQDGRRSFEEWTKMEKSVYIRKYESADTIGLFGFPRDIGKFWKDTNVLWIDEGESAHV